MAKSKFVDDVTWVERIEFLHRESVHVAIRLLMRVMEGEKSRGRGGGNGEGEEGRELGKCGI